MSGVRYDDVALSVERRVLAHLVVVNGPVTVAALQGATGCTEESVRTTLGKLVRLEAVRQDGDTYRCTDRKAALHWFRRTAPGFLPGYMRG